MAAIPDLAAASSVAAGDLLVVNQSGTDRKVTADKLVIAAAANTVSGVVTFSTGPVAAHVKPASVSLANNATQALPSTYGLLIVQNATDGGQALVWLSGGGTSIINQTASNFATTAGTASKINVYISGGVAYLENKLGATKTVYYQVLGV
jgi:hypothetical protein